MSVLPDWMIENHDPPIMTPLARCEHRPGVISFGTTSYGYDARVGYKFKVFSPINAKEIDPKNFDPKALVDVDLTPDEHQWGFPADTPTGKIYTCVKCQFFTHFPDEHIHCKTKPNHILIPPHSFALAETIEEFSIPRDVLAVVLGKSTYARCGLIVNVTPLEPEWKGKVTVELSNTTPLPMRVYAGEGIMQVLFFRSDGVRWASNCALESLHRMLLSYGGSLLSRVIQEGMTSYNEAIDNNKHTCKVSYADKKGKYQHQSGLTLPKVEGVDVNDPRR